MMLSRAGNHVFFFLFISVLASSGCQTPKATNSITLQNTTPAQPTPSEWVKCAMSDDIANPWLRFKIIQKRTGQFRVLGSKYEIPGPRLLGAPDQALTGFQDLTLSTDQDTHTLTSQLDQTNFVFLRQTQANANGQMEFKGFIQLGRDGALSEYVDQQVSLDCQETNVDLPDEDLFTGDVKLIDEEKVATGVYGDTCDVHTLLLFRVVDGRYVAQVENRLTATAATTCYPLIDADTRQYQLFSTGGEHGSIIYRGKDARGTILIIDHRNRETADTVPMKVQVEELRDDPVTREARSVKYLSSDAL